MHIIERLNNEQSRKNRKVGQLTVMLYKILINILLLFFLFILGVFIIFMIEPGIFLKVVYKLDNTDSLNSISSNIAQIANDDFSHTEENHRDDMGLDSSINAEETIVISDKRTQNKGQGSHLYKNFKFQQIHGVLEIPSINVRGSIISGNNEHLMEQGFWHVNANGAWLQYGNIVIFGHRYYHLPPLQDTFFNLDKVKKGDSVMIYTSIGTWVYTVKEIKVVKRNDFSIFKNTQKPQLTLVTCHPLWTSRERLVVIADLSSTLYLE